jgi:ABC-type antimicrobial peptide transport system permease subunit
MADTIINGNIDKYAHNIRYGTQLKKEDLPDKYESEDIVAQQQYYNEDNDKLQNQNEDNNDEFLNQQIRLNNLKEVDNYKQITIYIMYFILLLSCGLLFYLLK